jgi:cullin 3
MVIESSLDKEKRWLTALERRFLQTSREFYKLEAAIWKHESTPNCRQRHIRKRIEEEKNLCQIVLWGDLAPKVCSIIENEFGESDTNAEAVLYSWGP